MPKKIVYIVNSLYQDDYMSQLIGNKINWLAEHSDYDIYLLLTEEEKKKKAIVELSPKVHVTNLALNFHELDNRFLLWKICSKWNRQRKYKSALNGLLKKEKPEIIVSLLGHEIEFINQIKTKGHIFAEIHDSIASYIKWGNGNTHDWLKKVIVYIEQIKLALKLKKIKTFVVDTDEACNEWNGIFKNVHVIHNPLISSIEDKRDTPEKIVLAVGDFHPSSGYEHLIEAWRRIIPRYQEWRLRLYGNGDMQPYKQLIKNYKLSKSVYCYALEQDMENIYARTSIFVHTLNSDRFGQRIMEAQSFGIPCIAFDTPYGPKDLIKNEENGFLLYNKRITDLSCKLGILMRNDDLRNKMEQNTLKRNETFHLDHIMEEWKSLFEQAT